MSSEAPPLLLDAMLGRLARWLRLMGYDAAFLADTPDLLIVRKARSESRLVLTRDHALSRHRGIEALFIEGEDIDEQIAQVVEAIGPAGDPPSPRCGYCNQPLIPVDRDAVGDRVPPYVLRTESEFRVCEKCRRVYWPGTHWESVEERIDTIENQGQD
ncbi:MAG: Mut7-C RNAse domain-containing protein [Anaerolineae bacterium]|nr:Mut7-C RNAse domain-containing protein [Anaerolineae bacterium]